MTTIGLDAWYAFATAVTTSVTPGPAVTTATPGLKVMREYPSAACPADCSCRVSTIPMSLFRQPS